MYRRLIPYGVALGTTGIALLLSLQIPTLNTRAFFYIAVAITAWQGGLRPAITTITLSLLAINYWFVPPVHQFHISRIQDALQLLLFLVVSLIITLLNTNLQDSRKKVEHLNRQLIHESADRLRVALNAAQIGMWDWSLVTGEITWSPEHEQLFGLPSGTFNGQYETFTACIHPDDLKGINQAITHALNTKSPYQHEYRVIWADGSIHWIEGRGQVFDDATGRTVRMLGTVMNIDERKQAERALQELNTALEQRVADRTAELTDLTDRLLVALKEQASAEAALRESEERRRLALELTYIGTWDLHLASGKAAWDDNAFTLLGLAPGESPASYHLWREHIHPDDVEWVEQQFQRAIETHTDYAVEHRVIHPDRSTHWVMARARATYDAANQPVRVLGVLLDISDRKQTEAELYESEQRLQLALEGSGDGLWDWNITTGALYLSPRWLTMLGYEPGEFPSEVSAWEQLIHPDDRAWVMGILAAHLRDHSIPYRFDYRVRTQSGEWKWIANYGKVTQQDKNGAPLRMTGTHRDVSDRKQAEATLAQLASVVESSEEAIISKTLEGIVISWNASAERLFGYSAEEMIGQSITAIIPPDRLEEEAQILAQLKRGERIQQFETIRQRKDGSLVDIAVTISPVKDGAGRVIGVSKIAHDITEKRAVERMKDEFISIVSHELRTPLTSIRGSLGLLAMGIMDDDPVQQKRMIEIAAIDTERLVRLVNDVLDLEKLESGRVSLAREWCYVADLMQRSMEIMERSAEESGVQLVMDPCAVQIWADPDRIIQTLTNLLSNAIKFSPPGGIVSLKAQIQCRSEQYSSEQYGLEQYGSEQYGSEQYGSEQSAAQPQHNILSSPTHPSIHPPYLLFSVQDQGRGIPADQLETIFGRFQQVDTSDSRAKGGTGLGLTICRSIAQQHHGDIWVESVWGQGSTFFFALPLTT
ncbi:MAG: PAS domain-containing protein [Elainella sp. Prado103]|jgi:PAS domain S-box-containing protein|nr:PAS domain-containing protein [Elainella sp. Prado103]